MPRAIENTTCDIYAGRGNPNADEGEIYVVALPCRLVAQEEIVDTSYSIAQEVAYIHFSLLFVPQVPQIGVITNSIWPVDVRSGDRLAVPTGTLPRFLAWNWQVVTLLGGEVYYRISLYPWPVPGNVP